MVVKIVCLVTSLIISLVYHGSARAAQIQPVYSLKNLGDHQTASGEKYQKVQVKCNTTADLLYIHRVSREENWCVNGDSSECFAERIDAATRACNLGSRALVAPTSAPLSAPSAEELQAQAERKKLEEELLANEQKKIELRARQLELRKRELQLLSQQNEN